MKSTANHIRNTFFIITSILSCHTRSDAYFLEKRTRDGKGFKPSTVKGYTNIITRHFKTWLPLTLTDTAKLTPEIVIKRYIQIETEEPAGMCSHAIFWTGD